MTLPLSGGVDSDEVFDLEIEICDAHHHLWDIPGNTYRANDLVADLNCGHRFVGTVFVEWKTRYLSDGPEALRPVGEVAYAAKASRVDERLCAAIVGFADLTLGDPVAQVLEAQIFAGSGRFRGVRYVGCWDDDPLVGATSPFGAPGAYADSRFCAGFSALQRYGLVFDAWAYQTQLQDVIDLATRFPDQPIVMNHTGGPLGVGRYAGRSDERFAQWRDGIRSLAQRLNVVMKIGGLGMSRTGITLAGSRPAWLCAAEQWRPWVLECIDAFGPSRCMFESNFPVDRAVISYRDLWSAFKALTADMTRDEQRALFSGTASAFYRIEAAPALA